MNAPSRCWSCWTLGECSKSIVHPFLQQSQRASVCASAQACSASGRARRPVCDGKLARRVAAQRARGHALQDADEAKHVEDEVVSPVGRRDALPGADAFAGSAADRPPRRGCRARRGRCRPGRARRPAACATSCSDRRNRRADRRASTTPSRAPRRHVARRDGTSRCRAGSRRARCASRLRPGCAAAAIRSADRRRRCVRSPRRGTASSSAPPDARCSGRACRSRSSRPPPGRRGAAPRSRGSARRRARRARPPSCPATSDPSRCVLRRSPSRRKRYRSRPGPRTARALWRPARRCRPAPG